jgi:transcriptional regulator with XRE-family HTH domain
MDTMDWMDVMDPSGEALHRVRQPGSSPLHLLSSSPSLASGAALHLSRESDGRGSPALLSPLPFLLSQFRSDTFLPMPSDGITRLQERLDARRRELRIGHETVAAISGVSIATVKRVFGGELGEVTFRHVAAVAEAVGLSIEGSGPPAQALLERRAAAKARRVAESIQSAAVLSGRGVAADDLARLESAIADELLLGSPRRLWS